MNEEKRIYILDTNVLLHDPRAIDNFEGVPIGIPSIVLEEIDTFKKEATDRGRNAREIIRRLDDLRSQGSLKDGVLCKNGTTIRVLFLPLNEKKDQDSFFTSLTNDNDILRNAVFLQKQGYSVKLISKDLNVRVKADALGIATEDYLKEHVSEEEFYKGWIRIAVPSIQLKNDSPKILEELTHDLNLAPNEFVLLESKNNPFHYRIFRYHGEKRFTPVSQPSFAWSSLQARNPQQLMALNLLLDDSVRLVTLLGSAGTGKTFLALLAGLQKVLHQESYEKILVSRPVVPLGRDIGYLPGDIQEKLHSWMLPIYDNMDFIVHAAQKKEGQPENNNNNDDNNKNAAAKSNKYRKHMRQKNRSDLVSLSELIRRGILNLEAITYMRGRSIPYQFILIDETQNLTPHEVKTIVTRVGEGSKIVLVGDPYQIDSPYLDFSSNGLVITSERFKGNPIFGSVFLETSERSLLSQLAADLL